MSDNDKANAPLATNLRTLLEYSKERNGKTTQQQLAQFLGVSKQAVSLYCKGESLPNCYQLLRIAEFFGVSTDYLLTGIKPENQSTHDELGLSNEAIEQIKNLSRDKGIISRVNALLSDKDFFPTYIHALSNIEIDSKRFLNPNGQERENPERSLGFLRFAFEYALHDMADFFRKFFRKHTDIEKAENLYDEIKSRLFDEISGDNSKVLQA